ncbi:MAG: hypothetical protein MUC90_07130, partial [Thermoplasmata archaeon]|nr:hypothetical protein [Thermoplasmata archaeon]
TPEDASFCVRCGRQLRNAPFVSSHRMMGLKQQAPDAKNERKTLVLIAAVVSVVVVLPIVLAAILYVMVLGFGGAEDYPPTAYLSCTSVVGGFMFTFSDPSHDVYWSDVTIRVSDYYDFVSWDTLSSDLDGGAQTTKAYALKTLGDGLQVYLNVTDLAGNGMIDDGDFFTLSPGGGSLFDSEVIYEAVVIYQPTGATVCMSTFGP